MSDHARELVTKGLPWRSDVRWEVVAAEAIALIGIGGFMLIDTETAGNVVLQIIGVVLLVTSLILGAGTFRDNVARLGVFDAFRAGIGVAVGAIATASWWSDYIQNSAVRMILGWGLVAYSILHFAGLIAVRGRAGLRLSVIVLVALTLVLGLILLTSGDTSSTGRIRLLGSVFVVFGILLGALAYFLYSRKQAHAGSGSAQI
jgi:uncharacterized membrane protein HdeD (DUF308 family)